MPTVGGGGGGPKEAEAPNASGAIDPYLNRIWASRLRFQPPG